MNTEKFDSIQNALDFAIRDSKDLKGKAGYKIGVKTYYNYMKKEAFEKEINELPKEIKEQFDDAPGGELKEKPGRWGIYPPKMACFGSSSRFICNELMGVENVSFEAALPTYVGHPANLDAHKIFKTKSVEVFAEAKCREIYGSHRKVDVNKVYLKIYDKLKKLFTYTAEPSKEGYVKCTFEVGDSEIVHFDLKQLICHFLGIAAGVIEGRITAEKIRFVYVIFNPNLKDVEEKIVPKYRDKILQQYKETLAEIKLFDMKKLFAAIFEIQKENPAIKRNINEEFIVESCFEFVLADQSGCADLFKE